MIISLPGSNRCPNDRRRFEERNMGGFAKLSSCHELDAETGENLRGSDSSRGHTSRLQIVVDQLSFA
jgi:hypothetical protein